jgi:transposase-like protein
VPITVGLEQADITRLVDETSPVLGRQKFRGEYERGVYSVAELCRRFGISRKTAYKRLKRFDEVALPGSRTAAVGRAAARTPSTLASPPPC